MITYELAKQLKDAGFPQTFPYGYFFIESEPEKDLCHNAMGMSVKDEEKFALISIPTLSELIEACSQKMSIDIHIPVIGSVGKPIAQGTYEPISGTGETPEEAVVNLWLALQK
jgi:hypothetical protein